MSDSPAGAARWPGLADAIGAWRGVLGPEAVSADEETLARYGRTTQAEAPQPGVVLFPNSTEQVQEIVRIASQYGVVVYPISCGKNWGYGDACPSSDGAAIVDLGRMNRIVEVNRELAYCVIEPGVTQGQLYDYLQENDTGLWMDATAAGPESSLVGNTADRGFGHTRYGDHILTVSGLEIVLADGRVLRTGFGHYPDAKATHVYPYGVGPFMDGLFTQSNYGIITRLGLWLMPEPEAFSFFYIQAPKFEDFPTVIDRLRPLRLQGVLQTAIHIGNDFRVIAGSGKYPWELAKGVTPLPRDVREILRKEKDLWAWNGSGSISGTKDHVRASKKALKRALDGLARVRFVDDKKLELGKKVVGAANKRGVLKVLGGKLQALIPNYELLKGVPTREPLRGAQWRLRNPTEEVCDPLDPGVGLYWVSPVMPMLGAEAMTILKLVEPVFTKHDFDMIVSFILLTERCLVAIFNVAFDKSVEGEPEKASACYSELVDTLHSQGYYIYRAGLQGMPKLQRPGDVFWDVAAQIKQTLDPKDIIARGRYIPPQRETP